MPEQRELAAVRFPATVMTAALAALSILIAGCADSAYGGRSSGVMGAAARPTRDENTAREAFTLVNRERVARGMPPLARWTELDAAAYAHARDLIRMNRLSHLSSDGRRLENRLARLDWVWAGENLARNKGFDAPAAEAVRGWIASPRHYENMFRPDFRKTGIAAIRDPASGFTYFVQLFVIPGNL